MRRNYYPHIKQLTPENWLEPDRPVTIYISIADDSIGQRMNGEMWLKEALEHRFNTEVPAELHALLDVARGAFVYGYFYYPLYTLGTEQLCRVAESAVSKRYTALGGPERNGNRRADFNSKINWLSERGIFSGDDSEYWHTLREIRNRASHPEQQDILTPPTALAMIRDVVYSINALFNEEPGTI